MNNYFDTDAGYKVCKLCNTRIKIHDKATTSNILRHMRDHHPLESQGPVKTMNHGIVEQPPIYVPISGHGPSFREKSHNFLSKAQNVGNTISINPHAMQIGAEDLKLIHPFSLIVSGPTSSGKSTILFQILENLHQNTKPAIKKVVFIYGTYQEIFKNYPNIFFTDDLDYIEAQCDVPTVIILDDVMSSVKNSQKLEELFTRGVHHRKVSVILTLQNLFYHGSVVKTLRDYIILTRHIQDVSKLDTFARQLERKGSNYFKESYEDAISKKYGYVFCDLHPHSELRDGAYKIKYRTLIHKSEGQVLYIPKDRRG